MKLRILGIVFAFLSVTSCMKKQVEGVQVVDIVKFENKMKEQNVQLIDVRTPEEFQEGHLENAQNMNVMGADFDAQVANLDKTKPVLVYCKSGGRSSKASEQLKALGFTNITDLEGGFTNWSGAGKPVVKQ